MSTILTLVFTISLLVLVHELGHFLAAKWAGIRVDEFGIGMGPRLLKVWNDGETDYTINLLPIGGYVKLLGEDPGVTELSEEDRKRSFANKPPLARAVVLVAGITMNLIIATIVIGIVFAGSGKPSTDIILQITEIKENSPAETAKLNPDNLILSFKDPKNESYPANITQDEFISFVSANKGNEIHLLVQNSSEDKITRTVSLTPRENPPEGEGAIGITFQQTYTIEYEKMPWWQIPGESIRTTYELIVAILQSLGDMLSNLITQGVVPEDIAGPIGVAKITDQAAKQGLYPYLQIIALISINLAIVNILPFPALDGGRLVFVLIEAVTKKKVLQKYEGWVHTIGFFLLMLLVFILSYYDIKRFF